MESRRYVTIEQVTSQASAYGRRQRAVCYATRGPDEVLIFERDGAGNDSGVQLPTGGFEPGETPVRVEAREAVEETGIPRLSSPRHPGLCGWSRPETRARQVWITSSSRPSPQPQMSERMSSRAERRTSVWCFTCVSFPCKHPS